MQARGLWLGGAVVRAFDLRLEVARSIPAADSVGVHYLLKSLKCSKQNNLNLKLFCLEYFVYVSMVLSCGVVLLCVLPAGCGLVT